MKVNVDKVFEMKRQDEEVKIEWFPFKMKNRSLSRETCDIVSTSLMSFGDIKLK